LWPGLAALWLRGRWGGLVLAFSFGLALQFALLCTFAPASLPIALAGVKPFAVWGCVLGFWIVGMGLGWREQTTRTAPPDPQLDEWFREAQTEYLKGHWFEAETLLGRLVAKRPDDVEGRLLLASVQRRTGRLDEARLNLDVLRQDKSAQHWGWEIRNEEQRIEDMEQSTNESTGGESTGGESTGNNGDPPLASAASLPVNRDCECRNCYQPLGECAPTGNNARSSRPNFTC
jgi:hypothetical protein